MKKTIEMIGENMDREITTKILEELADTCDKTGTFSYTTDDREFVFNHIYNQAYPADCGHWEIVSSPYQYNLIMVANLETDFDWEMASIWMEGILELDREKDETILTFAESVRKNNTDKFLEIFNTTIKDVYEKNGTIFIKPIQEFFKEEDVEDLSAYVDGGIDTNHNNRYYTYAEIPEVDTNKHIREILNPEIGKLLDTIEKVVGCDNSFLCYKLSKWDDNPDKSEFFLQIEYDNPIIDNAIYYDLGLLLSDKEQEYIDKFLNDIIEDYNRYVEYDNY